MTEALEEHYGYLVDRVKLKRYEAAIERVVRADHVVLDLGCGSGSLGLMALRAGARKVLFVEKDPVIEVARRTVAEAGFEDRAEFFRSNSFELTLPERADVVLCDHVGYFGFDYGLIDLLADARHRFLNKGGVVIPAAVDLQLAPVESKSARELVQRWRDGSVPDDYQWVGTPAANAKHGIGLGADDLLADAKSLAMLTLGDDADEFMTWQAEFTCVRDAMLDGLLGWFNCTLQGDIAMTNSPTVGDALQRPQAFLPLEEPVSIKAGQRIHATVMARHRDHVIAWIVELPDTGQRFSHTTFNGLFLDDVSLQQSRPDRVAKLNDHGRARQIVLGYCDGSRTVAEIETLILDKHAELFPSQQALQAFVRSVLAWDTSE